MVWFDIDARIIVGIAVFALVVLAVALFGRLLRSRQVSRRRDGDHSGRSDAPGPQVQSERTSNE